MTVEPVKCPSTNVIPDIEADGTFGAIWCTQCRTEFFSCTETPGDRIKTEMNALLPYARGFVLGYLVHAVVPQPYMLWLMLVVCGTLILSGFGALK